MKQSWRNENMYTEKKPTKVRFLILLMLFVAVAITYLDRANLSVAGTAIQKQLKINSTQLGVLFSAFTWSYVIVQIPVGMILDKIGARFLYGGAMVLWGFFTFAMAFSSQGLFAGIGASFMVLIVCRILIGIAEGPAFPSNTKIAALWFPSNERARAISIYSSAQYIGLAVFTPILAMMVAKISWESVFYLSGGIAIVFGIIWLAVYRDPKDSKRINQEELDYLKNNGAYNPNEIGEKKEDKISLDEILYVIKQRRVWGIFITQFAIASTLYFFMTWFIVYLQKGLKLPIQKAGFMAILPYMMAMAGVLFGGFLSDYLLKKTSLTVARKIPIVAGLLFTSILCLANFFEKTPIVAVIILSIAFFANAASNLGWVALSDVLPKSMIGRVGGVLNLCGNLSGIVSPIIFGVLHQKTGNFHLAMDYTSAVAVVGALAFLFIVDKVEPVELSKKFHASKI
nr:MFS transporter [Clostridium ljungdahlii]